MKLKNNIKKHTMILFTLSMLFVGISPTTTTTGNNGMPGRVFSGEFGDRIDLIPCLINHNFGGIPCDDVYVSASEGAYVHHGWNEVAQLVSEGQPVGFQLYLDGEALNMRRFAQAFRTDQGETVVLYIFYVIFKPGSLSVGTHSIEGVWTSSFPDNEFFNAPTNLIVGP
ncbi:MAG: hypothetical protein GPJ54_13115 [Candidatus Heimdallarchaeota archaeon]|nr:hypothetical protein [Candidatus Heimdallarchaeota archaeon]